MAYRKKYTIFLVPHATDKEVKKIPFHSNYLAAAVAGLAVFLLLFILMVWDNHRMRSRLADYKELQNKVFVQEQQVYKFAEQLNQLNRKMTRLNEFNTKIRIMTNLEQSAPSSQVLNVGGAADYGTQLYAAVEKGEDYMAEMIDSKLEQMDQALYLEEKRAAEIDEFLKDQKSYLAGVPSVWPVRGWLSSGFGYRISPFTGAWQMHEGIDIGTQEGRKIIAPADGKVVRVKTDPGFGKVVMINHGYGYKTLYAHLSQTYVKPGDIIKRGDKIAAVGNTGRSTGPHLHYEVHLNNVPVNPLNFILN